MSRPAIVAMRQQVKGLALKFWKKAREVLAPEHRTGYRAGRLLHLQDRNVSKSQQKTSSAPSLRNNPLPRRFFIVFPRHPYDHPAADIRFTASRISGSGISMPER
jgi:hypothetical protein